MPSSTSWQRYDEEHNVSAILTEAARACVVENPRDVTDYLARYFHEVAGGTSVKTLEARAVMGGHAGPAVAFTLALSTGPEVSITTADATDAVSLLHHARKRGSRKDGDKGGESGADGGTDDEQAQEWHEASLRTLQFSLLPQLCRLGNVEPQTAWDRVLETAWQAPDAVALSAQWVLSLLASLAAAKQRRIHLYQHMRTLLETSNKDTAHASRCAAGESKKPVTVPAAAAGGASGPTATMKGGEQNGSVDGAAGIAGPPGRCYAPPRLLVPFLINDTDLRGADASGQVHFAKVYVGLEPITYSADQDGSAEEDGGQSVNNNNSSSNNNHNNINGASSSMTTAVDGKALRRRVHQLHRAARLFLRANVTAREGAEGCVYWSGVGSLVELVRAVTDALEAAELRPAVDVCVGLSLGSNEVRVRSAGDGDGTAASNTFNASTASAAATSTTSASGNTAASKAAAAAAAAAAADPSGLYDFFHGDSPITGEQLSEYVKEQLDEIGHGVVQLLEDTHSMDDTVARQRLQLALQDTLVLSGCTALPDNNGLVGAAYAAQRTADVAAGTYPATVVDLARCGTVQAAVQFLRSAADTGRSAVTVVVGPAAGDAAAAAHLVDIAVAGHAATLLAHTGPLSATTMAVATRLAAVLTELTAVQSVAPRVTFKHFSRRDIPPLPEVEVAPIRHKGDKKKKETRKPSTKKK